MNNGTPHDFSHQEYICDLSPCTFHFDNRRSNKNILKAMHENEDVLAFAIQEQPSSVDVFISFPDDYDCVHYKKGKITSVHVSKKSHLTYHGQPKRKKLSGEIHVKSDGDNPLKGEAAKTEAPIASSSNIEIHPLPICRIELCENPGRIAATLDIENYFQIKSNVVFFNTIEVHLARRGYMNNLASVARVIPDIYSSLFINMSTHAFFLGKIERRPGRYPQALVVQTGKYELIVLATNEFKNPTYKSNTIRYFYTKDYFRDLGARNVISLAQGWFIDQSYGTSLKPGTVRLSDIPKNEPSA